MEQRDLSKTMQQASGIDHIVSNICQFIQESPNSPNILSNLAGKLANLPLVETCIVVSIDVYGSTNKVGFWQKDHLLLTTQNRLTQLLSSLSLAQDDLTSSQVLIQKDSHLFKTIDRLVKEVLPGKSWLGVVTRYQQKVNGLILLFKPGSCGWSNSEQKLLPEISGTMAIAISQIQLQQQVHTKAQYQSLFKNISREISQSSHPQSLFNTCLAELCTILEVDRGMILMLKYQNPLKAKNRQHNSVKGTVRITSHWSDSDRGKSSEDEPFFSLSDSDLCQKAWHNAPKYLCFSADTPFPDLAPELTINSFTTDGSALLMMPLMGKKSSGTDSAGVLGFLVLQYIGKHHWLEDELDLIDWICVQLSTALVHHQTLNQVQSIVEERTAKLKWSSDVQAKLSAKMRQHIDQLQNLNQLKDDFMNSMSHELKTPLTSMKIAIKMLRHAELSPEMHEKYFDILEQEWDREYSLIKDLLTLQQVESGKLTYSPQELNLSQTIDNLAQSFNTKWQMEKGLELKISVSKPDLKINTDVESLEHILSELLLNAAKYSDENTVVELLAQSQTTLKGKDIVISVANTGAEITPEELPYIFDKFRRGKGVTDRAVAGTGLGLTLVQYLVEHLNGTIEVTNEPAKCDRESSFLTTFVLRLPQFQPSIS